MKWALYVFLLIACSPVHRETAPGNFVVALERYPSQLDPRFATGAFDAKVSALIFNGLFRYDDNLQLVPDLAAGYEYLDDFHIKIILRERVRFHDGSLLKSHDVQSTYMSVKKASLLSPYFRDFQKISKITVLDDSTLVIELKEVFAPILSLLTLGVLPTTEVEKEDPKLIGTGHFAFVAKKEGSWIKLKRNPNENQKAGDLESITFKTVADSNTRILELMKGNLDLVQNAINPRILSHVHDKQSWQIIRSPGIIYHYLGINLEDPILKKLKVRQALAYSLDRKKLIQFLLKSYALAADSILNPNHWAYQSSDQNYEYNPEKAKRLLDEAGFPDPDGDGPKLRFELKFISSNQAEDIDKIMSLGHAFKEIGVGVKIRSTDFSVFKRDVDRGNFQIFALNWVGVCEPDIFYFLFNSKSFPPLGANRGHYHNQEVDLLTSLARLEIDNDKRKVYYGQIQNILQQDLPYISLWYQDNIALLSKKWQGYTLTPQADFSALVNVKKAE